MGRLRQIIDRGAPVMEKLSTIFASFPEVRHTADDREKKNRGLSSRRTEAPSKEKGSWSMLLARDQLYGIYRDTAERPEKKEEPSKDQDLHSLKQKSEVLLDLGSLDYKTKRKEEELRSWAHYKIGLTKMLHTYNILYSKFYRDLTKDVLSMNKASNLTFSSPKQLMDSMGSVQMSMKSFVELLQPMAHVANRMNEVNMNIMKIGKDVGSEGANKVFTELSEKIQSYPDVAAPAAQVGRTSDKPTDELMVGKFYQDWTIDSLHNGVSTLQYAMDNMKRHTQKLKNLALVSKTANATKAQGKEEQKPFSLPSKLALDDKGERGEKDHKINIGGDVVDQKKLDEIELGAKDFKETVQIDIPDIMNNEMLKDPNILNSESLAQASLGKDITGLDDTSKVSAQNHGGMF
jgi:hypothetical protein